MPKDRLQGSDNKYILIEIDAAIRYKVARPMRTKNSETFSFLQKHIYENAKIALKYPKISQCNNGSELKGLVTGLLKENQVEIRRATTKYNHSHTALVENLNLLLGVSLFKIMNAQELNKKDKISTTWVKHLYGLLDKFNNTVVQATGKKPIDAIKLDHVN